MRKIQGFECGNDAKQLETDHLIYAPSNLDICAASYTSRMSSNLKDAINCGTETIRKDNIYRFRR